MRQRITLPRTGQRNAPRLRRVSRAPVRGRHYWLPLLLVLIVAGVFGAKLVVGESRSSQEPFAPRFYIAVPHPATGEMRREAAYLSRKYDLREIEEPGAPRVEIRR